MFMKSLTKNEMIRLGGAGLRLFFRLSENWKLTENDQASLLGLSGQEIPKLKRTLYKGNPTPLTMDMIERLSLITGIQKYLEVLYSSDHAARAIQSKNNRFGMTLLEYMLGGNITHLREVVSYLDSCSGSHYQ